MDADLYDMGLAYRILGRWTKEVETNGASHKQQGKAPSDGNGSEVCKVSSSSKILFLGCWVSTHTRWFACSTRRVPCICRLIHRPAY